MIYMYIRNSKMGFYKTIKMKNVSRIDDEMFHEFLPLAIKHAINAGFAIYNDWTFSCWNNLDNEL